MAVPSLDLMKTILKEFLEKRPHLKTSFGINNGYCGEFSDELFCHFSNATQFETCFDYGVEWPFHVFTKIGDKYYDAECLEGVTDPINLPIFKKFSELHPNLVFESTEIPFE